jgi:hypothetical protein
MKTVPLTSKLLRKMIIQEIRKAGVATEAYEPGDEISSYRAWRNDKPKKTATTSSSSTGEDKRTKAKGIVSGNDIQIVGLDEDDLVVDESDDQDDMDEASKRTGGLLNEGVAVVMQDTRGPYVIADGVEARPLNPNRTQYTVGRKVRVNNYGRKGEFIVEMPNGERWSNAVKSTKRSTKKR